MKIFAQVLLPITFIWCEFYQIGNKKRLFNKVNESNFSEYKKIDFIYYLIKLLYFIWVIVMIPFSLYVTIMTIIGISTFLLYGKKSIPQKHSLTLAIIRLVLLSFTILDGLDVLQLL